MTIRDAGKRLLFSLYHVYDAAEAANIAELVMEHVTGWRRAERMLNDNVRAGGDMIAQLETIAGRLNAHEPVQYVLEEAWFCDMKFHVNQSVLIPRPETEELVHWIVSEHRGRSPRILDIGTGSGCIAIALKKLLSDAIVYACDVSTAALDTAKQNADDLGAEISLFRCDILLPDAHTKLPEVDIIVSNPPYIPQSDKTAMSRNVVDHEPHIALFVNDDDPLIFYRQIANFKTSAFYFEVHEDLAAQVAALFTDATIKKDMQGKDRMLKASRSY